MRWNRKPDPQRFSASDVTSSLPEGTGEPGYEFSAEVARVLSVSGWSPNRRIDVSQWRTSFEPSGLYMHDAAERFLSELGGVIVRVSGTGVTAARNPFEIDPMICLEEVDLFKHWSLVAEHSIYPAGDVDKGRYYLGIDEEGVIYVVSNFLSNMGLVPKALEKFIVGYKADSTLY